MEIRNIEDAAEMAATVAIVRNRIAPLELAALCLALSISRFRLGHHEGRKKNSFESGDAVGRIVPFVE